jgi:hypothetical protein
MRVQAQGLRLSRLQIDDLELLLKILKRFSQLIWSGSAYSKNIINTEI